MYSILGYTEGGDCVIIFRKNDDNVIPPRSIVEKDVKGSPLCYAFLIFFAQPITASCLPIKANYYLTPTHLCFKIRL